MSVLIARIWFVSVSNVYLWLNVYDVKYPHVVLRQSILETGWYKCSGCSLDKNNIFGFKTSKYIIFNNWTESIKYYKQWQLKYMSENICSESEYLYWLKSYGYASDTNYINKLRQIII